MRFAFILEALKINDRSREKENEKKKKRRKIKDHGNLLSIVSQLT